MILRPERMLIDGALLTDQELVVQGGRIAAVRARTGPVDLPGQALIPGFVNAHSHAFQRGLRGHVQWADGPDDFSTWRVSMYGLANGLSPEGIQAVSALAFLEMARAGFTAVGEFHYLQHQPDGTPYADPDELAKRVVAAARQVGLRINLLRVAYARAGYKKPADPLQRRFIDTGPDRVLEAAQRLSAIDDEAVSVGLAPHSVRAVPQAWLAEFSGYSGVVHAHVAEQRFELQQCRAENGCEPLSVFERAGLMSERFTAVHLTLPDREDAHRLLRTGARVCVCPSTELDLGDGFYPTKQLEGVPMCVGTDSHAQIDPFYELRSLELHARGTQRRRNVLSPQGEPDGLAVKLLRAGTAEGAEALGMQTGSITPGLWADLVSLDLNDLALVGSRPLTGLVFNGHPGMVVNSWVGGRPVVVDRGHAAQEEIVSEAVKALERLRQ